MGLRALEDVGPVALLGSWARMIPSVEALLVAQVPVQQDGKHGVVTGEAATIQWAEREWRATTGDWQQHENTVVDWEEVRRLPDGLPLVQRRLTRAIDDRHEHMFRMQNSEEEWVRLQNCAGPWASLWLTTPPAEHGTSLLDVEYATMVRWRLGLPILPRAGECALCGEDMDARAAHTQSCSSGAAAWNPRHHSVDRAAQGALRWAGCAVRRQQAIPGLPGHIPDFTAEAAFLPTTHVEVHVAHPCRSVQASSWGDSPTAFVRWAWQRRLVRDYRGGPPAGAPYILLPAVVSTYGAWHQDFVDWVRRFLRDRVSAASEDNEEAAALGGATWRVAVTLSVAVQRAVLTVLARCIPGLAPA